MTRWKNRLLFLLNSSQQSVVSVDGFLVRLKEFDEPAIRRVYDTTKALIDPEPAAFVAFKAYYLSLIHI